MALATTGCANTIRGIGRDTANTVDATQNAGANVVKAAN
ncbi:entericidin [Aquibium carbonis]